MPPAWWGPGGLSLRRELERVTEMLSNSSSRPLMDASLGGRFPRTMVYKQSKHMKLSIEETCASESLMAITLILWLAVHSLSASSFMSEN